MKVLKGAIVVAILMLLTTACSTTEPVSQETEPSAVAEISTPEPESELEPSAIPKQELEPILESEAPTSEPESEPEPELEPKPTSEPESKPEPKPEQKPEPKQESNPKTPEPKTPIAESEPKQTTPLDDGRYHYVNEADYPAYDDLEGQKALLTAGIEALKSDMVNTLEPRGYKVTFTNYDIMLGANAANGKQFVSAIFYYAHFEKGDEAYSCMICASISYTNVEPAYIDYSVGSDGLCTGYHPNYDPCMYGNYTELP